AIVRMVGHIGAHRGGAKGSRDMECGRSSGVEHNLAKVRVVSSNLIARSKIYQIGIDAKGPVTRGLFAVSGKLSKAGRDFAGDFTQRVEMAGNKLLLARGMGDPDKIDRSNGLASGDYRYRNRRYAGLERL